MPLSIKTLRDLINDPARRAAAEILNAEARNTAALKATLNRITSEKTFELSTRMLPIPNAHLIQPPLPSEKNHYQSAGILMRKLASKVASWRESVPPDAQPVIVAILHGGYQINVELLAEESFHGIRIEGTLEGGGPCMVLAHQSSVQLLCYIEKIEREEQRRKIGFIIDGQEQQV